MPSILITGCSTGFGLETARHFLAQGWHVVATMRTPDPSVLPTSAHLQVLPLDVTDAASIRRAAEAAGPVDALVNNAGVGLMSIVEATPMETVRGIFEANTFGTIAVTQAFLPMFREQRHGTIVNVSSGTTLAPMPMLAVYTASKAAVNAFTESLALELDPFGVRVGLVIPGRSPETPFSRNAQAGATEHGVAVPEAYAGFAAELGERRAAAAGAPVTLATDVAAAVWRLVTDPSSPRRVPAGADAVELAASR